MAAVVRPAFILFYSFFLSFLAKMASNWGCALSSNAPYSRINTVYYKHSYKKQICSLNQN